MTAQGAPRTAVILAGGLGTRLAPYTAVFPKPLVPIGQYPVMDILVRQLAAAGFSRLWFSVGHLAELVEAYFLNHPLRAASDLEIDYIREHEPLGTAGSLRLAGDRLPEAFLVLNGDILTDVDFAAMLERHVSSGAALTIASHGKHLTLPLGVIEQASGRVTGYVEKPSLEYEVSMGIYAYSRRALEYIPESGPFDLPELVHRLLEAGETVLRDLADESCSWHDIGNPDDYAAAQQSFRDAPSRYLPDLP
ncbi:NTP transferase domain-containing protein [Candidatus Fermentibacterales bacterium]|nr:NTP transferase domain-containing protein [Candidatus Fermentibacterales bacterium]